MSGASSQRSEEPAPGVSAGRAAIPHRDPLAATIVRIAAIWIVSDVGYYFVLPSLGVHPSYNAASVGIALYYFFWIGIAIIAFWDLYRDWVKFGNRTASYAVWTLAFGGCTLFAAFVLPLLPPANWTANFEPPDLALATEWYFLPKSMDILFQQLLIAAFILALSARDLSLKRISVYSAALFGVSHLLLAFGGVPFGYVVRFMVAATLFGFLFPYLILRVPNGLGYSYVVHWAYYAATVAMVRFFGAPAA
ncbi:MAG: hypothetical protein IT539_11965 [Bradyrhizobiaceae bacterium]|nr:hypothetical protein [Bradyrhizobiaceae bacterium]